jgi:nucleoside-diphosphate-sugar epimerase
MILLTGASGFVGKAVFEAALRRRLQILPTYRTANTFIMGVEDKFVLDLDSSSDWSKALDGVQVVIHTAARTHVMREKNKGRDVEYAKLNMDATLNLARQAAAAGVKRFIFLSSIKVNGESTTLGHPFTSCDHPAPEDAYGRSKADAEQHLKQLALRTGMEVTVIRPPMIYGPGVKGNFALLASFISRGLPLPLSGVTHNRRSLVSLDNLVDLILKCTYHPNAGDQTFLISDQHDLSTAELMRKIGNALGQPARLLWVPAWCISLVAYLTGKKMISQRLLGSLQVDMQNTCELLDWTPPVSVDEGLRRAFERK